MPDSIAQSTCAGFLAALASTEPTPGGGAVAGLVGAASASLGEMVAGYSLGRSDDPATERSIERIRSELSRARVLFLELADEDAAAYAVLNAAFKLPRSDQTRPQMILAGATAAVQPPLATLAMAGDVARLLEQLQPVANANLRSDLAIAARLADSSATAALWNIRANAPLLGDSGPEILREAVTRSGEIRARSADIEKRCGDAEEPS